MCKLMDYGKYRFEQSKREKEARKISMWWRSRDPHVSRHRRGGLHVKLKNAQKFLADGDRVKVSVRFRRPGDGSHRHR